jgi:hypothetical protein
VGPNTEFQKRGDNNGRTERKAPAEMLLGLFGTGMACETARGIVHRTAYRTGEKAPLAACLPALGALHTEGWSVGCAHAFSPSCTDGKSWRCTSGAALVRDESAPTEVRLDDTSRWHRHMIPSEMA